MVRYDKLEANTRNNVLFAGGEIWSPSQRFRCSLKSNGKLMIVAVCSSYINFWEDNGSEGPNPEARLQADGNFVIYTTGSENPIAPISEYGMLWATGTDNMTSPGHCYLVMQDNGNLVLYDGLNHSQWASNTRFGTPPTQSQMKLGDALMVTESLWDPTNSYRLTLQSDGQLVVKNKDDSVRWRSGETFPEYAAAAFTFHQSVLNMAGVDYSQQYSGLGLMAWGAHDQSTNDGQSTSILQIWVYGNPYNNDTYDMSNATLKIQEDGNVVLYQSGTTNKLWETNSAAEPT